VNFTALATSLNLNFFLGSPVGWSSGFNQSYVCQAAVYF
jgi:hypothetical protein